MGSSEPCRKWAVMRIFYLTLGFPGSCPGAYSHPGCWERTIPAAVPVDAAKVNALVDSQKGAVQKPFVTFCPRCLCVFSSHKPHRASTRGSFLLSLCSPAADYLSQLGRGDIYVFAARTESCLRQESLSNLVGHFITLTAPFILVPFLLCFPTIHSHYSRIF